NIVEQASGDFLLLSEATEQRTEETARAAGYTQLLAEAAANLRAGVDERNQEFRQTIEGAVGASGALTAVLDGITQIAERLQQSATFLENLQSRLAAIADATFEQLHAAGTSLEETSTQLRRAIPTERIEQAAVTLHAAANAQGQAANGLHTAAGTLN